MHNCYNSITVTCFITVIFELSPVFKKLSGDFIQKWIVSRVDYLYNVFTMCIYIYLCNNVSSSSITGLMTSLCCYFNFKFQLNVNESLVKFKWTILFLHYIFPMFWLLMIIPFLGSSLVVLVKEWKKYFSLCCQTLQY